MGGCKGRPEDGRRPTRITTMRPTGSSRSSFDEGLEAGRREANKLWRDAGNRCSSAWGDFQNTVDRKIRARGWNTGGNRSFNQSARAGMKEVVVEKEKECFRDSADECVDLGNEAARMIAYSHCGSFGMNSVIKKWRRNCRDAAELTSAGDKSSIKSEMNAEAPILAILEPFRTSAEMKF